MLRTAQKQIMTEELYNLMKCYQDFWPVRIHIDFSWELFLTETKLKAIHSTIKDFSMLFISQKLDKFIYF